MIIAQENLPLSLWKMENNSPDCLVVGFIFYVYVCGFFFFLYTWWGEKVLAKYLLFSAEQQLNIKEGISVCASERVDEGCVSLLCVTRVGYWTPPRSWPWNKYIPVCGCVWVPTFSHRYTLILSWTQGNLYGPDGCVVGHCVVLSTAEHSDIYCLCTGNRFWHTPST